MRIMQVSTVFLPGGIQRHVLDLTADLRQLGHTVILAGGRGNWGVTGDDPDFYYAPLERVAGGYHSKFGRLSAILPSVRNLRRAIKERGIEIVHAHETAPAIIAKLATVGLNIPVILTFHGSSIEREASVAKIANYCADLTVSPSHASIEALISKGLPRDQTRVLGLGVAHEPTPDPKAVTALRADLLDGHDGPLILSVSRLAHQKGIDLMVDVVKRVTQKRPNVKFVVAGGGPQEDLVGGWAKSAGVEDKITFLGPIETIPLHLAASDVFLLTSRWEALPISIVEAFRAGLPVVATDCGGVRELVDDQVGALLEVGDVQGTADVLIQLADDADLRNAKGRAALSLSQQDRFDPEHVHKQFEALYAEMLGHPKT